MQPRTLGTLAAILLLCGAVLSAQTAPPGSSIPGPAAPRPQTPPRDPAGNPNAQQPKGTALIRGRVVGADSGTPLRRAQVRIASVDGRVTQVTNTDGDGRYEFPNLPANRYIVNVTRSGYVTLQFGQQRPFEPGKPLDLADAQVMEKIDFALPRGGVITGRITDEIGEPIAGVQVMAMRYQYMQNGQRQLIPANTSASFFGSGTDDLGQFRVYGLMPGTYVFSATSRNTAMMMGPPNMTIVNNAGDPSANDGYITTYYPGTANPDEAQPVTVTVGQEASVYFSLVPARMARVSGTVRTSDGRAATGSFITLRTVSAGMSNSVGGTQVGADGSFSLNNVPPGEHFLDIRSVPIRPGMAVPGGPPAEPEFASVPLSVNGQDITGMVITTTTGTTISGRMIFDGSSPVSQATGGQNPARIFATPADSGPSGYFGVDQLNNGLIDEGGRFQIRGANGRVIFRATGLAPGWILKSVTLNGVDITDAPFDVRGSSNVTGLEVVITDRQTTLTGAVKNSRGEPVKDYTVAILPDNLSEGVLPARFIRTVRPDQQGQYKAQGLPPGAYVAIAVESLESGAIYDPAYQQVMKPRGKDFRLTEGQTLNLDLRLAQ